MSVSAGISRTWLRTVTSTGAVTLCSLVTSILTARLLGPEGRGLMAAVLLVATLSSGVAQSGIASSLVYHRGLGRSLHFGFLLPAFAAAVTLLTVPLTMAGLHLVYPAQLKHEDGLTLALAAATAAFTFTTTVAQVNHDLKVFNAARVTLPLAMAVFLGAAYLAAIGIDHVEILSFQLAVTVAVALYCSVRLWRQLHGQDTPRAGWLRGTGPVLNYAWKHHGTVLLGLLLLNADKVFLLQRGNAAEFGIYALAFATTRVLSAVQDAAAVATFARFAGKAEAQLSAAVAMSFRMSFLPMLLVASAIALTAPWFVPLLFGAAFEPMVVPFIVLAFEAVVGAGSWTLAQRFNAAGRPGLVLLRQSIAALPLLGLLPLLPSQDTASYLAGLLLCAAALRLAITLAMYPLVLKEKMPALWPRWSEIRLHASRWRRPAGG